MTSLFPKFGKYEIKRRLRRGGMGDVYLAYDTEEKADVALKLIEEEGADHEAREAIAAEEYGVKLQKALCRVEPNVPEVKDFGRRDGHFYIVMEYIEGEDLSDRIERSKLPYEEVIRIATVITWALQRAHTLTDTIDGRRINQIVHGDIKPKNIRLTTQGGVKLLDFGIAKALSATRKLTHNDFGTLAYCSPERLETGDIDIQSDLWSFGVLLYEISSGVRPFRASSERELEKLITSGQLPPPLPEDCPKLLKDLITKALHPNAERRYQSATEMTCHLDSYTQGVTRRVRGGRGGEVSQGAGAGAGVAPVQVNAEAQKPLPAPSRVFRLFPLLALGLVTLVIALSLVFAASESIAWRNKKLLHDDLAGTSFIRLADAQGYWNRYKEVSKEGYSGWGLTDLRAIMKQKLADFAGRVIKDFESNKPAYKESDWKDAKDCLSRITEMGIEDSQIRAMTLYCEGHIERINGDALKKKSQDSSAAFSSAIRRFNDAVELDPPWADPHLGLAIVYTYGILDASRAAEELDKAKEKGLALGNREIAIRADGTRMSANKLYDDVRRMDVPQIENFTEVKTLYEQALEKYQAIPGFSADTGRYIRDITRRIQELESRIEDLETSAGEILNEEDTN